MNRIKLMINGLPGNVAEIICRHALSDPRFAVIPFSLTGPTITAETHEVSGVSFTLIKPDDRAASIRQLIEDEGLFITVDYTHPTAVNANTEFYCANSLPFVMGTTGGDRKAMHDCVVTSSIPAVISPNMAKQIVAAEDVERAIPALAEAVAVAGQSLAAVGILFAVLAP